MTPTHTTRNGTKRYRYYVCTMAQKRGWHNCPSKSIPAGEIEQFVVDQIRCIGRDPELIHETVAQARRLGESRVAVLVAERAGLERELSRCSREVRRLVITPNDTDSPATARLADLQERIRSAERRATEVCEQMLAMDRNIINDQELAKAMETFNPVWDSLTPHEQARIVRLLIERVDYDGSAGKVAITFYPSGIKTLADQLHDTEEVA